jgi:hypothetical protein
MALGRSGIGIALACLVVAAASGIRCGGETFSSRSDPERGSAAGMDGGSDSGGTAGTSGLGGASGNAGKGGQSGAGGSASGGQSASGGGGEGGAGGEPPCDEATPCPAGRYCDARGVCQLCTDITTLDDPGAARFGVPEPLTLLNDAAGDWNLRSPRVFGTEGALLYMREFFGGEIWLSGDADNDVGAPLPSPINEPNLLEGSPLWLTPSDGIFESFNFVFNRAAQMAPYEFQAAVLEGTGAASDLMRLPAPFNPTQPLTESSYQMALSHDRAWWMVNRDLMFAVQFLTAPIDQAGPPSVVPLPYSENCDVVEFDLGPWVTPDGTLLFVQATERTPDCATLTGDPHDLLIFKLDDAGQPQGRGVPVAGVSHPGTNEIDASLSVDMCSIYFVTSVMDKLRIMRARREG